MALRLSGLLAAILLSTARAQTPPATQSVEPFLAPRPGAVAAKPADAESKSNLRVCTHPADYPPLAFDLPQLSAAQVMALFDRPATVRELLGNIKILSEQDLLVQPEFFNDDVLLKFFGATQVTWEKSAPPMVYSKPYSPLAFGPIRVAHVKVLNGQLANVTARVVSNYTCMGWRETVFVPHVWWPPVTYLSGYIQIGVSPLESLNVGLVKESFGTNPAEAGHSFIAEFGGGVSFPGNLTYHSLEKERRAAPFAKHEIEIIPRQTGDEHVSSGKQVFADETKLLWINITQNERDM